MSSEFTIPGFHSIPYLILFEILLFLAFAGLVIYLFYVHYYYVLKPDELAVISRNGKVRIVDQGFVVLIPLLDEIYFMPKVPLEFTVETENLRNVEGFKFQVCATIRTALDDSPSVLTKSSRYFKSVLDISSIVNELFKTVSSIELMDPDSNIKNLCEKPNELEERIESNLREELFERGLMLLNIKIVSIDDSEGIMSKFR